MNKMPKPINSLGNSMPPRVKMDPVLAVQMTVIPDLQPNETIPLSLGTDDLSELARKNREAVATLLKGNFDVNRKSTRDDDTADYLVTGLLQVESRTMWMLRRHLP